MVMEILWNVLQELMEPLLDCQHHQVGGQRDVLHVLQESILQQQHKQHRVHVKIVWQVNGRPHHFHHVVQVHVHKVIIVMVQI